MRDPAFLTCILELKLDKDTFAKWKWDTYVVEFKVSPVVCKGWNLDMMALILK